MNQTWCLFFLLYLVAAEIKPTPLRQQSSVGLKATEGLPLDTWQNLQMCPSHTHTHKFSPAKLNIEDDGDVMHYSCNQLSNINKLRTSLVVQERLRTNAGGPRFDPDPGVRLHMLWLRPGTVK